MDFAEYQTARASLLANNCAELLSLEEQTMNILMEGLLDVASNIKADFDSATNLKPFWQQYAPVQRGYRPRGQAYPWGEVGEKVVEGYLYSLVKQAFEGVRFLGIPYGHDIRFSTNNAFIHIDAKSTGPTDNVNQVVSSPNQVSGNGRLNQVGCVVNDVVQMRGARVTRDFQPELAPFYIINGVTIPTLTFYLKVVYSVEGLGVQPLDYLELICVPNGLALFDGPNLNANVAGLLTPGKDEVTVVRKRTRINLDPLSRLDAWRCQKIKFSNKGPYLEIRRQ